MKDMYTKKEIDLLFERLGLVIKNELAPLYSKVDSIETKVNGITESHSSFVEDLTKNKEEIISIRSTTKGALWAFGITIPILLAGISWIFFNEIMHIKEDMQITSNTNLYDK